MAGLWAIVPDESGYGVLGGTSGIELNRCVADLGRTELGGGVMRFQTDDAHGPWTVTYDEIFYVLAGRLTIESSTEGDVELAAGRIGLIESGTTVTYRGVAGTVAFYVLTPRDWEARSGHSLEVSVDR